MFDFLSHIPLIGNMLTYIVPFLIVLGIVIFIHEFGHYIVGRWCGIQAQVFSLGIGPTLKSWVDRHGTSWQIAALPLGGYVMFLGDGDAASSSASTGKLAAMPAEMRARTFGAAPLWKRALTVSAGPGINFIASFVIFSGVVLYTGVQSNAPVVGELYQFHGVENQLKTGDKIVSVDGVSLSNWADLSQLLDVAQRDATSVYVIERSGVSTEVIAPFPWLPIVGGVAPASPAARAGLKVGDLILKVGPASVFSFRDLQNAVLASNEERVTFLVQRADVRISVPVRPLRSAYIEQDGSYGERVQIGVFGGLAFAPEIVSVTLWDAVKIGAVQLWRIAGAFVQTISGLLSGEISPKHLNGPLGIAVASGDSAAQGLVQFGLFVAYISTAIGLVNLLPIPVLDGGHLVIFAYQAVFKRQPNERILNGLMLTGLCLLIGLVLYATFFDGVRLFR